VGLERALGDEAVGVEDLLGGAVDRVGGRADPQHVADPLGLGDPAQLDPLAQRGRADRLVAGHLGIGADLGHSGLAGGLGQVVVLAAVPEPDAESAPALAEELLSLPQDCRRIGRVVGAEEPVDVRRKRVSACVEQHAGVLHQRVLLLPAGVLPRALDQAEVGQPGELGVRHAGRVTPTRSCPAASR
jgi:hypothetical protein